MTVNAEDVIHFWFEELEPKQHFIKDENVDAAIKEKFLDIHSAANKGECWHWRVSALGRLAEIIVLDQFSRNIFRGSAKSFASDTLALCLAQEAIAQGCDAKLTPAQRAFLYMPFMHSESLLIHEKAMQLFAQPGLEHNYEFEIKHKDIIDKFGRYPHRNDILGRVSTEEEVEFLQQPGSGF